MINIRKTLWSVILALPIAAVALPSIPVPGLNPGLAIPTIPPAVLPTIPTTQILGAGALIPQQVLTSSLVLPPGTVFNTPTTIPGLGVIPAGTALTNAIALPPGTSIGNISIPPGVHTGLLPTPGMIHNGLVTSVNGNVVSSLPAGGTIPTVSSIAAGIPIPCIAGTNNRCYQEVPRDNDPFVFCTEGSKKHNVILSSIVPPLSPGRMMMPALQAYAPPMNYPAEVIIYPEFWPTSDRPHTDNYGWFGIPLPPYFHREKRNLWLGVCLGRKQGGWGGAGGAANQVPSAH